MPTRVPKREPRTTLLAVRGNDIELAPGPPRSPLLLAPLESSVVALELFGTKTHLDRASIALVPAETSYRAAPVSPMTVLVHWPISPSMCERAVAEYGDHIPEAHLAKLLSRPRVLPRTRWVDELIHRYVFERDQCKKHGSKAAQFLETEITKELYFLCKERDEDKTRASVVHEEGDLVARARAYIESNLALPLRVGKLAAHCHTSESTLVRAFRRELGQTPMSYARERRLDAALLLLESGGYRVGQVAERVGYSNFAAFSSAFHKRFGVPPKTFRPGERVLDLLPPEGKKRARR
jgi:AraC-like DNA-binding protein